MVNWDKVKSQKELLVREMLYEDPRSVVEKYNLRELKDIFLSNLHRFDRKNRAFWKFLLDVSDDEIARAIKENVREANGPWDY